MRRRRLGRIGGVALGAGLAAAGTTVLLYENPDTDGPEPAPPGTGSTPVRVRLGEARPYFGPQQEALPAVQPQPVPTSPETGPALTAAPENRLPVAPSATGPYALSAAAPESVAPASATVPSPSGAVAASAMPEPSANSGPTRASGLRSGPVPVPAFTALPDIATGLHTPPTAVTQPVADAAGPALPFQPASSPPPSGTNAISAPAVQAATLAPDSDRPHPASPSRPGPGAEPSADFGQNLTFGLPSGPIPVPGFTALGDLATDPGTGAAPVRQLVPDATGPALPFRPALPTPPDRPIASTASPAEATPLVPGAVWPAPVSRSPASPAPKPGAAHAPNHDSGLNPGPDAGASYRAIPVPGIPALMDSATGTNTGPSRASPLPDTTSPTAEAVDKRPGPLLQPRNAVTAATMSLPGPAPRAATGPGPLPPPASAPPPVTPPVRVLPHPLFGQACPPTEVTRPVFAAKAVPATPDPSPPVLPLPVPATADPVATADGPPPSGAACRPLPSHHTPQSRPSAALPQPRLQPRLQSQLQPLPLPRTAAMPAASQALPLLPHPLFGKTGTPDVGPVAAMPSDIGAAGLAAGQAGYQAGTLRQRPPVFEADDELILELATANGEIGDTVIGYGTRSGVFLPLGEIARLLDLAIIVGEDGRYASGWVLDEANTVEIDLRKQTLQRKGTSQALAADEAVAYDGELYLRADRFGLIMPLSLRVNLRDQTVRIETLTPFPFEQRAQRAALRLRVGNASRDRMVKLPRLATPWEAVGFPLADVELRMVSDTGFGPRSEVDLRLASDLAFMTARAFGSFTTRDGLVAARLELGRRDPDGGLLGPLHATQFRLGDIATTALPLGLRGIAGLGFQVSNAHLGQSSVFDRIDLRGELPDGYEAELYRNNTLIGSTRTNVNGQYEFLQVPVEFGLNVMRVVLYGPQGQRREDVRRISVGDGRVPAGSVQYDFGLARKDVSLLDARGPTFSPPEDYRSWRLSGSLLYGVSPGLTASLGGAVFDAGGARNWLATTGFRTGLAGLSVRVDAGFSDSTSPDSTSREPVAPGHRSGRKQGKALGVALAARTAGINWTASHFEYRGGFADEVRAFTMQPLQRASELDLNAVVRIGSAIIPVTGRARRLAFADGRIESEAGFRSSVLVGRILSSNSILVRQTGIPAIGQTTSLGGTFDLASVGRSRTQVRAALDYTFSPNATLTAVRIAADRTLGPEMTLGLSAGHVWAGRTTTLGLTLARRIGPLSLGLDANLSLPHRVYSAGLRLGFGFGRNPVDHRLFAGPSGMSASGLATVRVFADDNADGRFDAGEETLEDVSLTAAGRSIASDENGMALLEGLGDGLPATVQLDNTTLPDVDMAPLLAGFELVPRAGRINAVDVPVIRLVEISGTTQLGDGGKPLAGLQLELVGSDGKVAARARTGSGGNFLFEQVRPGRYRVVLNAAQARKLGIVLQHPSELLVDRALPYPRLAITVARAP